ncbi:calcium-binding protein [Sinorhizobium psoraleae]|uniref:Calcium-binding protein n=1 Tax=Sinorhizobium psoraleae TaxID=520838 RepID=A0ABT4KMB9_9HYPH|nr:calcium-binding protein [Sinorhizobium psoraleae]MCZ4093109.1 calcium-binding protein [Sinorhizobium psoraleae]
MLIRGGPSDNSLLGSDGDDLLIDPTGNDWIDGARGNDSISAGEGNDRVFGGAGNDHVFGEAGNDYLYGDNGRDRPPVAGQDNDKLYGGPGDDVLFASDGRDQLTGDGQDTFVFRHHNPVPAVDPASWPNPGYTVILDFDPNEDTFAFDAAGHYSDGTGANFLSHASSRSGHGVDAFYSGAASEANGEDVVVVTDKSFFSGDGAANAIAGETTGDIIVYHDDLTKSAVLAYVTSENHADEFARLASVHSLADLAALGLSGWDFTFV